MSHILCLLQFATAFLAVWCIAYHNRYSGLQAMFERVVLAVVVIAMLTNLISIATGTVVPATVQALPAHVALFFYVLHRTLTMHEKVKEAATRVTRRNMIFQRH